MTVELRKLLEDIQHELVTSSGLYVRDNTTPNAWWQMDNTELLKRIDKAFAVETENHVNTDGSCINGDGQSAVFLHDAHKCKHYQPKNKARDLMNLGNGVLIDKALIVGVKPDYVDEKGQTFYSLMLLNRDDIIISQIQLDQFVAMCGYSQ